MDRRGFLRAGGFGALLVAASCARPPTGAPAGPGPYGALQAPDALGIQLPRGFTARVVARSLRKVAGTGHRWHLSPDGGACFGAPDGGWVYVSNSEVPFFLGGGVGAVSFAADGRIRGAYRILSGTTNNCAGGPTPWGTWLSCEENVLGQVWECDPHRPGQGVLRAALGRFTHEAAAVDPVHGHVYLTEDERTGRLYRFRPDRYPSLATGVLEAASVDDDGSGGGRVTWVGPLDQQAVQRFGRPPGTTEFRGGEGCWYDDGTVYFTTKGDGRVWALDCATQMLRVLYRPDADPDRVLTGVDNVTVTPRGDVMVAEDGGNMELVLVEASGRAVPFLRVLGQDDSEITGPAFSPDGRRLYFSSQRGASGERAGSDGVTYEVVGPFGSR